MKLTKALLLVLSLAPILSGCWASKEETTSQLQRHVDAYKQVEVTPGNAKLVIKGADLLLSKSEENKFSTVISLDQERAVNKAKILATNIVGCSTKLDAWKGANPKDGWKEWKPNRSGNDSSQQLASHVTLLKQLSSCSELVAPLNAIQKAEIDRRAKATSGAVKAAQAKEKAEKEAADRAEREKAQAEKAAILAKARKDVVATAEDYNVMMRDYGGTCSQTLYEINAYVDDSRGLEAQIGATIDPADKPGLKRIMRRVTGC
jgi:hypothetical protein